VLPSVLEAWEIETLLRCIELCLYYRLLSEQEEKDVAGAREKLVRYLQDECGWHGVIA
jgi:hypothetical protein